MLAALTINHAPTGVNDSASTTINTSKIIDVLANDIDINGDELSIKENSITSFSNGGDASVSDNNTITYTPAQDFTGIETFTYIPTDNTDDGTPTTVTVTVNEVTSNSSSGGGCTYNPSNTKFDFMFIFMILLSLLYPLRHKYYR
jgi:hypothetical protein